MLSTQQTPRIHKRVQKAGCFFGGLRVAGFLITAFGVLTLLFNTWFFFSLAWSQASDLVDFLRHISNRGSIFMLSLYAAWFGTLAAIQCSGLVMLGIGFGLDRAATQRVTLTGQPIDKPLRAA